MQRRRFLGALLASGAIPTLSWADAGNPAYLAAAREADGGYALFGLAIDGRDVFRLSLPDRGHAAIAHPEAPEAVAFARRPGTFAIVINCATGQEVRRLQAPPGRHFYGHGAFVQNGEILVTTENEVTTGQGRLGLWSRAKGYARIGEISSGGIGPHDILTLPNGRLAVANGGIRTHPDQGRTKLNIPTMRPNLTYLTLDGDIAEQIELPTWMHKASIRHLAYSNGVTAFAMQWQGDPQDAVPLLGLHQPGQPPVLCKADHPEQIAMRGYAGSVAIANNGQVGITSPRGGRLHLFGMKGDFQGALLRNDVCGIACAPEGLLTTDGLGGILSATDKGLDPLRIAAGRAWDNHLIQIASAA